MTTTITRLLSLNLLRTLFFSGILTFISCQIIQSRHTQSFEGKQGDFIETIALIIWTLLLAISALTIYLNLFKTVRTRFTLSFLSFFFTPLLLTFLVWFSNQESTEWITFFLSTLLFFVTHAFFYIRFIQLNKKRLPTTKA